MSANLGKRVCVIGAGALGLTATKNFLEEGFDVTTYERNDHVGGLWHASPDTTQSTVLSGTISNISKRGFAYSDFPFADDVSLHPTAKETQEYLEAYAERFGLYKHIEFSRTVVKVSRDQHRHHWLVETRPTHSKGNLPTRTEAFDRLIISTGAHTKLLFPQLKNIERFEGEVIHGQQFKEPSKYHGKTILIIGLSATAADCISFLKAGGANKIYVSHRRQPLVLPRVLHGKPSEYLLSFRTALIGAWMAWLAPGLNEKMGASMMTKWQHDAFPELKRHPAFDATRQRKTMETLIPTISDDLATNLTDGTAESVYGVESIVGGNAVRLTDGKVIEDVDSIICCTGGIADISGLVPPDCDPANPALAPDKFAALPAQYREGHPVPRLYRGFISLQHPHSLAFFGHSIYRRSAFALYDLMSMALAQLWKGDYPMPSQAEMEAEVDKHYKRMVKQMAKEDVAHTGLFTDIEFDQWLQRVAGTGLYERLGNWTSWESWKLWLTDRKLYLTLMDGAPSAHALRLFDTGRGRKTWPGAKAAIEQAEGERQAMEEAWKEEQKQFPLKAKTD